MTPRTMDAERFYSLVRVAHRNLLNENPVDLSSLETHELDWVVRLVHGSHMALRKLDKAARDEMERREGSGLWSPPLRLVDDPDPWKNRMDV